MCREQLEPGDRLLLYTDGITEARNRGGEEFGLERFIDFLIRHNADGLPVPETLRRLIHASSTTTTAGSRTTPPSCWWNGTEPPTGNCTSDGDGPGAFRLAGRIDPVSRRNGGRPPPGRWARRSDRASGGRDQPAVTPGG